MNLTVQEKTEKYYMPSFSRTDLVLERGEGCYVYDQSGEAYLDVLAGIAVNALGYAHPVVIKAITEQSQKLMHTSNLFYSKIQADLVEKLANVTGFDKVFLCNSGAEANEGAIKLARKYGHQLSPQKYKIITAVHSFHGRTLTTLTATGQTKYQQGFEPLPAGFAYVEFGDISALEQLIDSEVCAVMLEVIQGEGGVNVATQEYLKKVQELCARHQALLIFDEVQTGVCRTGEWFAYQGVGVKPDIMTLAKALGAGFPIGAFVADDKIANAFKAGDHGSTFGGNQLACAVALAVLNYMQVEQMPQQVQEKGQYLQEALTNLQSKYPAYIKDVRGKGLLIGLQLNLDGKLFVKKCLQKHLIINNTADNVIRIAPPLIISKAEMDKLVQIINEVLQEMIKEA